MQRVGFYPDSNLDLSKSKAVSSTPGPFGLSKFFLRVYCMLNFFLGSRDKVVKRYDSWF